MALSNPKPNYAIKATAVADHQYSKGYATAAPYFGCYVTYKRGISMYSSKIMLFLLLVLATTISACSTAPKQAAAPNEPETIVFVCQHGNVKSLMAASYFNQMAKSQNLPYYAVSRSIEQESKAVPQPISSKLSGEGIDVSSFQSKSISSSDIITAKRVVTIGVALPENFQSDNVTIEKWDSIPSVSADFSASSNAMKQNLESLIYQLRPKTGQ